METIITECVDRCSAATKAQINSHVAPLVADARIAVWIAVALGVTWYVYKAVK